MKKIIAALVSTFLIGGVNAQTPVVSPAASAPAIEKSDAKRDANNEMHIKDLHAKLKITAGEEALWSTVAKTMRESAQELDQVIDKRKATTGNATAIDDLNAYGDIAQAHADSVKKLSMTFGPLYAAMSDSQKKIADEVFTQRGHDAKSARKVPQ